MSVRCPRPVGRSLHRISPRQARTIPPPTPMGHFLRNMRKCRPSNLMSRRDWFYHALVICPSLPIAGVKTISYLLFVIRLRPCQWDRGFGARRSSVHASRPGAQRPPPGERVKSELNMIRQGPGHYLADILSDEPYDTLARGPHKYRRQRSSRIRSEARSGGYDNCSNCPPDLPKPLEEPLEYNISAVKQRCETNAKVTLKK